MGNSDGKERQRTFNAGFRKSLDVRAACRRSWLFARGLVRSCIEVKIISRMSGLRKTAVLELEDG